MILIRDHLEEELIFLTDLFLEYIRFEYQNPVNQAKLKDPDEHEQLYREFFEQLVQKQPNKLFVAEEQSSVIGFGYGRIDEQHPVFKNPKRGYIQGVYVKPDFRGQGIGSKLVSALNEWFEQEGITEVVLMVTAGNSDSLEFFAKCGFTPDMQLLRYDFS